jgi:hypothetical protein
MRDSVVWHTVPAGESAPMVDLMRMDMRPPDAEIMHAMRSDIAAVADDVLRNRLLEGAERLSASGATAGWEQSAEGKTWADMAQTAATDAVSDTYKARLTAYLAQMMCRPKWSNGAVAGGIAERVMAPNFKGDMPAVYEKLAAGDCPAAAAVGPRTMRELAAAAAAAREQ